MRSWFGVGILFFKKINIGRWFVKKMDQEFNSCGYDMCDDRIYFEAGDKLKVRPMSEYIRKHLPASDWMNEEMVVEALEGGCSDGLDVWDVLDSSGEERSIYGVQVCGKVE
jgi:hypothetical protein